MEDHLAQPWSHSSLSERAGTWARSAGRCHGRSCEPAWRDCAAGQHTAPLWSCPSSSAPEYLHISSLSTSPHQHQHRAGQFNVPTKQENFSSSTITTIASIWWPFSGWTSVRRLLHCLIFSTCSGGESLGTISTDIYKGRTLFLSLWNQQFRSTKSC